tara:strand:+ start:848 stop:1318 length:471 start_codon:yes stop_codon:yes gene_type:complete
MKEIIFIVFYLLTINFAYSQSYDKNLDIDRVKLEQNREVFIKKNINLMQPQAVIFWPIYHNYRSEVELINTETILLLKEYARHHRTDSVSQKLAQKFMRAFMSLDQQRLNLKNKYVNLMSEKLPVKLVWRFFHIESNFDASIEYSYIYQIPLVNLK